MQTPTPIKKIGLLGGGPAALFMFKRLLESENRDLEIFVFEKGSQLGAGMPYSPAGANKEHITNVSDNEIPELVTSIKEWLKHAPQDLLKEYQLCSEDFNEYKVLPRLLFGKYLEAQFHLLIAAAKKKKIVTNVLYQTQVEDVIYKSEDKMVKVVTSTETFLLDAVVICTGHKWPYQKEKTLSGWYDCPYPPSKLQQKVNFPVAIKGASLTAIDAIKTLAWSNGKFSKNDDGSKTFTLDKGSDHFKIILHSLGGLLPGIRFHLDDTHLSPEALISEEEVYEIKEKNNGFISLDYIFDRNFKMPLKADSPEFYEEIKALTLEEFVDKMMKLREDINSFHLFRAEYQEAEKSIRRRQSVQWKESIAALSYAMNYPAKHFSAEDMLRLKKVLMPLISLIIAFVPQSSAEELMALYECGVLQLKAVDKNSSIRPADDGGAVYSLTDKDGTRQEITYKIFVDAVGQPALLYSDFPFNGLKDAGLVSAPHIRFKSNDEAERALAAGNELISKDSNGSYHLQVPGININDQFQVLDRYAAFNSRIYMMAVPYISGVNPDYSGLDFCETASERIVKALFKQDNPTT